MKILAIIVTYNAMPWAGRCFDSLRQSTIKLDVFVVDNGSTDGTQEYILQNFSEVLFHQSGQNLGFGRANNMGIVYALNNGYDYIYLLNQDAWIMPDTIEKLIEISNKHPEYAILSPFQMESDLKHIDKNFMSGVCNVNSNPQILNDLYNREVNDVYTVKNIMAAHWFMTRKCLETVGCFSPSFPHYGEDDNYSDRVYYWSMKMGIVPSLRVVHDRGYRKIIPAKLVHINYVKCIRILSRPKEGGRLYAPLWFMAYSIKHVFKYRTIKSLSYCFKLLSNIPTINRNRKESMNKKGAFLNQ